MNLKIVFSFLIISILSFDVFAGEAKPMASSIIGRYVDKDRAVIEYCQLGNCRSLGPETGYTYKEWGTVQAICNEYSYAGSSVISSGAHLGQLAAAMANIAALGKPFLLTLFIMFDGKVAEADATIASDMMMGLLNPDENLPVSDAQYQSLSKGIEDCTREYEWRKSKEYKRRVNGYLRPLG